MPGDRQMAGWPHSTQGAGGPTCASLHTRTVLVEQIVERVKAQHPYEVPGISARPIIAGNPDYLRWIRDETDGTNG